MMISEYKSTDGLKIATVFKRDTSYRVFMHDSYFETSNEKFFDVLDNAEDFAEDYVLGKNNGT